MSSSKHRKPNLYKEANEAFLLAKAQEEGVAIARSGGRPLPLRGVSTPGHGQGEGPVGYKLWVAAETPRAMTK